MATVEELRGQLEHDKARLRSLTWVNWGAGDVNSGMTDYSNQLTLVSRLQDELHRALKEEEIK